jgi:hypothetical protein
MQPETLEGREIPHDGYVGSGRTINNVIADQMFSNGPHFPAFSIEFARPPKSNPLHPQGSDGGASAAGGGSRAPGNCRYRDSISRPRMTGWQGNWRSSRRAIAPIFLVMSNSC